MGEVVGRGSFGTVYRARLETTGGFSKEVAIKLLNTDLAGADHVAQRLRDEARLLGLVRHRAILQVDGLVRLRDQWAVVTEYIAGVSLLDALGKGPMPPATAAEIVAEVASALAVAYGTKTPDGRPLHLVHRDIKPSNIQITAAGEVKVLDFGIAVGDFAERETETQSLVLIGSPAYMSPERLDGIDGPEGDVYALGAVLYEMLVGKRLGRTRAGRGAHDALMERAAECLSHESLTGAGRLADLALQMLDHDPERRPRAADIERACRQLVPTLDPPALHLWAAEVVDHLLTLHTPGADELTGQILTESTGVQKRSHTRWWVAAGLLGALALAATTGVTLWMYYTFSLYGEDYVLPHPVPKPIMDEDTALEVPQSPPSDEGQATAPPPPKPTPPARVFVGIAGDADGVFLVSETDRIPLPAEVAPGTYEIVGRFGDRDVTMAVKLPVVTGSRPVVTCQRAFVRCTPL